MSDKETAFDPEKLIQRYTRAKERRAPWEGHWRTKRYSDDLGFGFGSA